VPALPASAGSALPATAAYYTGRAHCW